MPRWKTTENILNPKMDGEYFEESWMNYDKLSQYAPRPVLWTENRKIRFEDVDLWEVILEIAGPVGVYAAYIPYEEYYIVTSNWNVIAEFEGDKANFKLELFLKNNGIEYPYTSSDPEERIRFLGGIFNV